MWLTAYRLSNNANNGGKTQKQLDECISDEDVSYIANLLVRHLNPYTIILFSSESLAQDSQYYEANKDLSSRLSLIFVE
jgi:hypothetical protein